MRNFVAGAAIMLALVLITACTQIKEVIVEQTVIVERTVVVAATSLPVTSSYRSGEVIGLVLASPGVVWLRDGYTSPSSIGVAVNSFCGDRFGLNTAPAKWSAELRAPGRWSVQAECGEPSSPSSGAIFSWQYFEDGARVVPSNPMGATMSRGP